MSQSPCSVCDEPLLRLRYFPGQLMTADDMRAEQEFLLKKARRHNRFLHGWGVTCGLDVRLPAPVPGTPEGQIPTCKLWVCPGYAVSPQGDDILVEEPVQIDLCTGRLEPEPCCEPWPCPPVFTPGNRRDTAQLWLAIRAAECLTRPVRIPVAACGCDETACDYSRISESFEIKALTALPQSHKDAKAADTAWQNVIAEWRRGGVENRQPLPVPPCPACIDEPWVVLATITVRANPQRTLDILNIAFQDRRVLLSVSAFQHLLLP